MTTGFPTRTLPRALVLWGASPWFGLEDEGDGKNDVRGAHARPVAAKNRPSWSPGQMLPRRQDRLGTPFELSHLIAAPASLSAAERPPKSDFGSDLSRLFPPAQTNP
jgi:hypothetical protein